METRVDVISYIWLLSHQMTLPVASVFQRTRNVNILDG